ncbi:hypothetical protein ABA31_04970 [Agrococcus baldri]|uniref:Extracellular solute-binding protein n=1 Tax=Agrococcus baldri TaxID=153730 RepID=A0AA87RA84_9MICO|nr:hypothetical protein ABA31_04970 [Agrococcus baldri]
MVVYTALPDEVMGRVVQDFGQRYGISLSYLRAPSGTVAQRFLSENSAGAPVADVVSVAEESFFQTELENGTFAELSEEAFPAMAQYEDDDAFIFNAFRVSTNPYLIAWNTDVIPAEDAPTSYEDLADARFEGQLGAPRWDASLSYPRVLDFFSNEFGDEWLSDFTALNPRSFDSVVPGLQALGAGEIGVYPIATTTYLQPLLDQGAPIGTLMPNPTTGYSENIAISSTAPHPNAAAVFLNYIMSEEGQRVVNGSTSVSLLPGASEVELPEGYVTPPVSVDPERTAELYSLVGVDR